MGGGFKWYLLKQRKSRGNALFDRSTKPNIQCTVSVYQKCHFQSKLKCSFSKSFQICIFLQILAIILIIPTFWAEKKQWPVQFTVQCSHHVIVLQLELELPARLPSALPSFRTSFTVRKAANTGGPTPVRSLLASPSAANVALKGGNVALES